MKSDRIKKGRDESKTEKERGGTTERDEDESVNFSSNTWVLLTLMDEIRFEYKRMRTGAMLMPRGLSYVHTDWVKSMDQAPKPRGGK